MLRTLRTQNLVEDPPDPGTDEYSPVTPQQLIEALKYSREMLKVVEKDSKLFDEDLHDWREESSTERTALQRRKDLVDEILTHCGDPPLERDKLYLRDIWTQYGRPGLDALAYRGLSIQRIKVSTLSKTSNVQRRTNTMTATTHE